MDNFEKSSESKSNRGLDEILSKMEEITAEWRKSNEIRDEGIRNQELPTVEELSKMEIPEDQKERVLKVIQNFKELADDERVDPILDEIKKKLISK